MPMKTLFWLFPGALLLAAASCSHKQKSTEAERLKWNMDTLVGDYDRIGRRDPKWDETARQALTDFAKIRAGSDFELETRLYLIGGMAKDAVRSGCDDPMIQFLYCRYGLANSSLPLPEKQKEFRLMVKSMESSGYSPLRRFYANLSAADTLWQRNTNLWPEVSQFRWNAMEDLRWALQDKTLPVEEAYYAAHALFQTLDRNARQLTNAFHKIEQPLFQNWPRSATSYLIKGECFYEFAWLGRGNATADRLSDDQRQKFSDRLKEAETALNKAWSLNPKDPLIPTLMINVVEGQQKPRSEMEQWFQRAMKLDTNNIAACRAKLHFLYPQWYGSRADMLEFGRECVASTRWGGKVPLILVDAHADFYRALRGVENRSAYWTLPDVWPDIKAAYEKFSRINPDENRFRYPYAAYARRCQQWEVFLEQIQLLRAANGSDFNEDYFGGKAALDQIIATAKQQTAGN
jgi:hypothetical protein